MKLTETERLWLRRLGDDWTDVRSLTTVPAQAGGIARCLSRLSQRGITEWRAVGEPPHSEYRVTDAGRAALAEDSR